MSQQAVSKFFLLLHCLEKAELSQSVGLLGGEYLVFEHGPFDFETQSAAVEAKVELAMRDFDYAASGYRLDLTPGKVFYFYHDCARFFKYVRPVCRD